MKRLMATAGILSLCAGVAMAQPVDTGWTYQGKLSSSGSAANGNYDMRFTLYSNSIGTVQVGSPQTVTSIAVSSGLFTAKLDLGAQFTGSKRWLKVEVSPAGAGTYTALPLQEITSAPQSLFSEKPWATDASSNISYTAGKVGVGRAAPAYSLDVNVTSGQSLRLGLDGNGGGQLLLANNANDNKIFLEGWNTAGNGSAAEMLLTGFAGGLIPKLTLSATTVSAQGSVGIGTATPAARLHVYGGASDQYPVIVENNSTVTGSNGIRSVVNAGASGNYSSAVTAINTVAPGAGQLNFGLYAASTGAGQAVRGDAQAGVGVIGTATSTAGYGGYFINTAAGGYALWADGPMQCKTLRILGGADLAEPFDVAAPSDGGEIRPGMVVVIDESHPGDLRLADQPYDGKVAGVISGANGLEPGMVMKAEGKAEGKHPVAMTGRVWVYVDATTGPVKPGDLLTTSATPGHAMKAADQSRAFGAVIGKAMTELNDGKGLVLVLVNLQ